MSDLPEVSDLLSLLLNNTPMLDVRAPIEFNQGAFPTSLNVPLLNDNEREQVGICYKQQGQDKAIELGHQLISGDIKARRLQQWKTFVEQHPDGVLYCFRGGQRSKISQQWITENSGVRYPRIRGGYKAMRRFLIDATERLSPIIKPTILSGRTGTGKTLLIEPMTQAVDLEGLAHHRGSAFGRRVKAQPTQINFEHQLAITLLKHEQQGQLSLLFEDESRNIGSVHLPKILFDHLTPAPIVVITASVEERVAISLQTYVIDQHAEFVAHLGSDLGFSQFSESLLNSIDRVKRRLGGSNHASLRAVMEDALKQQLNRGDMSAHRTWIERLLTEYYDPMYDYQLDKKRDRVCFEGTQPEVTAYLASQGIAP